MQILAIYDVDLAQKLKEDRLEKEKKLVSDSKEVEVLL
ncbi:5-(carboxyamino)imidazole ribonucleotide mutase, partial [Campylobacter jejuni]